MLFKICDIILYDSESLLIDIKYYNIIHLHNNIYNSRTELKIR